MDSYQIAGGKKLVGEIDANGAKNAVLPILAACIATGKESIIHNCPNLSDVRNMLIILEEMGCEVKREGHTVIINSKGIHNFKISEKLMREMRSSVFLMGPLIARFGKIVMSYPGGCEIGLRPIDIHIEALKKMGVTIVENEGYLECSAQKLEGNTIVLSFPSVGATENTILTAIGAAGETVIKNVAREPEIIDLEYFLNSCGANVRGAGTSEIIIVGYPSLRKEGLKATEYNVMADRIEVGTFLTATAITKGEIYLKGIETDCMDNVITKLEEAGCKIVADNKSIWLRAPKNLKAIASIKTEPHPGFPTDMQSQMLSLLTLAQGKSVIKETIFENRFKNIEALKKMGANICVKENEATIIGVDKLMGAEVAAKDLRGGAALVIAGLGAEGETTVNSIFHIDRGYEKFEERLSKLGAEIKRKK